MKNLFLLRGLPGSGKSTLAKRINAVHLEADQYFMVDSEYKFDPTKLKQAHDNCVKRCEEHMLLDNDIVVSNTFTMEWEMKRYLDLASEYGYLVHSLIVENRHNGVNTHNVPQETLDKMKNRFEIKL